MLNPALVLAKIFIDSHVLLPNWRGFATVWRRVLPIIAGLAPGVMLGAYVLSSVHPGWIKLATFAVLLYRHSATDRPTRRSRAEKDLRRGRGTPRPEDEAAPRNQRGYLFR